MNKILYDGEYIIGTAHTPNGSETNADAVEDILCHQPPAPEGFVYCLKTDLTWELCELPPELEHSDEVTPEDLLKELEAIL